MNIRWTSGGAAAFALFGTLLAGAQPPQEPEYEIVGFSFAAIQTTNVDDAADWYRSTLGLAEVKRSEADDGAYSIRILARGGLTIELLRVRGTEAPPERHLGLFKAGFYVDDVEAAYESMRARAVEMDARVFVDEPLQVRSFVFRDPDGNRLQVFERCDGPCE